MLLNINATRGPTDCCSATHRLLLSEAILGCGTRRPLYLIGDAASRTFTGRIFHPAQRPVERAPA